MQLEYTFSILLVLLHAVPNSKGNTPKSGWISISANVLIFRFSWMTSRRAEWSVERYHIYYNYMCLFVRSSAGCNENSLQEREICTALQVQAKHSPSSFKHKLLVLRGSKIYWQRSRINVRAWYNSEPG